MAEERGRNPRRGRDGRQQGEQRQRETDIQDSLVQVKRCSAVVKGGRRFSFNAVVVVGDKKGSVGLGYGKAKEVPHATEKAIKSGSRNMVKVPLVNGTVPHPVIGRFGASRVIIIPAAPGTGVKAGRGVRDVMVLLGVTDVLTKCHGSTNPINVIKATIEGLKQLRTRETIAELRGVTL